MKHLLSIAPLFVAALFAATLPLHAGDNLAPADKMFAMKAAQGGMMEVRLGELAEQKAQSEDVKDFGKMMTTDHSKANAELTKLAMDKDLKLPATLNKEHMKSVDKMSKLSGKEFDDAYVADMVADHRKDVGEFEKASHDLSNPDLKAFATKTLPTLKMHLKKIEAIQSKK